MEQISSGQTFFVKKVFPVLWFGIVLTIALAGIGSVREQPQTFVFAAAMVVMGSVLFRKLIWGLADDVRDGGTFLLVRRSGVEERVPLANVMNVSMSQFSNPRRLTLRLRTPGRFGDEVTFIPKQPPFRLNPFARNAVAEKLIARVDAVRLQGAAR